MGNLVLSEGAKREVYESNYSPRLGLHLVPRLRRGAVLPFPPVPSWRAQGNNDVDNIRFILKYLLNALFIVTCIHLR